MAWGQLFFAGLLEVFWSTFLKLSEGFSRPGYSALTLAGMAASFLLLSQATKVLPLGTAYGIWTGIGALGAVAVVLIWTNVGYYMVMYIAGIDGISPDVYEAATIDGAGDLVKFYRITLPLLSRVIRTTIVLCISTVLSSSFVLVTVMTNGAPAGSTSVLLQYMYDQAFGNSNFGYAMAIAVVTLALAFVLAQLSRYLTREKN